MKTKPSKRASRPQTRPRYRVVQLNPGWVPKRWAVISTVNVESRAEGRRVCRVLNQHRKG